MSLTPEEREIGRDNYYSAVNEYDRTSRRGFLKNVVAAGSVAGLGAMYFGYAHPDRPVRIGVIGTGDEGNVLIGALNPDYVEVKWIADIRPSSIHRAFNGDWASPNTIAARPGLMDVYGWSSEDEARKHVKVTQNYQDVLNDPDVEGVIIAVPLHLHCQISLEAMKAGKHVLVEKLMAHNVAECKLMARASDETRRLLATGHQRHYSILYDNAVNLIRWGVLGEIHHIRAQWHRGNLPGSDSWAMPVPGGERMLSADGTQATDKVKDKILEQLMSFERQLRSSNLDKKERMQLTKKRDQWAAWNADKDVPAHMYGYQDDTSVYPGGKVRTALEELVRWRLWERTGGGLMAELGSHQLDASSIFISALSKDKVHPLTVHAVGGRHIFPPDRDADDHVYCMFEFPGPGYEPDFKVGYKDEVNRVGDVSRAGDPLKVHSWDQDPNKKIVVTYSSINGNGYGGYGEIVMGTKGTLVLEREKEVMLYQKASTYAKVGIKKDAGGAPTLDTTASGDVGLAKAAESGPVSRGYKEQIEHWAWCIRSNDWGNQPRCTPKIALGDAVIALTSKLAIRNSQKGKSGYIEFDPQWFDPKSDAVPEDPNNSGEGPNIQSAKKSLGLV